MDRLVAIKLLHPRLAAKQDLLARLDQVALGRQTEPQ